MRTFGVTVTGKIWITAAAFKRR